MKIFIDSANIEEIKQANQTGLIDGVTTNPTLIAKSAGNPLEVIEKICNIVSGDVSAEVFSEDFSSMVEEGEVLYNLSSNIVLKLPLTEDGLKACKFFSEKGKKTNITLCFSATQALLAAKAGATYISPFIGRLEDIGQDGMGLIRDIRKIYDNYSNIKTQILAASIRNLDHVKNSALFGADVATFGSKLFFELYKHELTNKGLEIFRKDIESIRSL